MDNSAEKDIGKRDSNCSRTCFVFACLVSFILGIVFTGSFPSFVHPTQRSADPASKSYSSASAAPAAAYSPRQPWGEFEYIKIPLEEPHERLPDTRQPLPPPRWFFEKFSQEQLVEFLKSCELTGLQKRGLLNTGAWEQFGNGFFISPPPELILDLSRASREKIYAILSASELNSAYRDPFRFPPETFDQWLAEARLSTGAAELLRKLVYRQGGSICFADSAALQAALSPKDFDYLVRILYAERTFLMRLMISADTDIESLVRYWQKGGRAAELKPLFESMAKVPGGASINVSYLLPAFARVRLYTYAKQAANTAAAKENCYWTAMNFFSDKPDPQFFNLKNTMQVLREMYRPISGAPRYGDLVLITDPTGKPVHMCVYLADGVVFTKNGGDHLQPWVLMKIPDMLAYYSMREPARTTIFRAKEDSSPEFKTAQATSRGL